MNVQRFLDPFPHAIVDDYLNSEFLHLVAREVEELPPPPRPPWHRDEHADQVGKAWVPNPGYLFAVQARFTARLLLTLNKPEAVRQVEYLSDIRALHPDPEYVGGGLHRTAPGGRLEVHADFNLHPGPGPCTGMHRRVNALLYLNDRWDPSWGGDLELWAPDMSECRKKIEPVFNRLVVFQISDRAFHGHPHPLACPPDRARYSLALYYYTADRPEAEKAPFHWASWQKRPAP